MTAAFTLRRRWRPSPNHRPGRDGERVRAIVVHTTAGTAEAAASWFERPESGVSAHYLVALDGDLTQFVAEDDTARHAGRILRPTAAIARAAEDDPDGLNRTTIGIEFEDGGDALGVDRPAAQYETGAALIAEIAALWDIPIDRDHVIGHREAYAAKDCPGNLDVERLLERAAELAPAEPRVRIACLLPARDAAEDLPGYLGSAAELGAAVVALDDGSTDETGELLAASPRVATLLRNPARPGFSGWDDGANRRRLLAAAAQLEPDWVLFLDADERLDGDDAIALRRFLAGDAIPGVAYGLQLFRDWEGMVVPDPKFVFRLFAFRAGQELGDDRFHFNPVPREIPRSAWVRTTIRARHLDSPQRLEGRRAKYRAADPKGRYLGPTAALLSPPPAGLVPWTGRDPSRPTLEPRAPAAQPGPERSPATAPQPTLLCLLPARNCATDLPGYLESVGRFADGVVALDDGSTDETAAMLEDSPLVVRVLRNPPRPSYAGWDDRANRQQLLDAAAELGPRWVLFLDADERIDVADAAALRSFLETDADPGAAYGFRVHRMLGDGTTYDRADLWVYRLFSPRAGQGLPEETLHLVPVPTAIPRARWQKTTIRIQHLASLDEERRLARVRKYAEADPDERWQAGYADSLLAVDRPRPWLNRPEDLPVLADPARSGSPLDLAEFDPTAPLLSVIVIARNDEDVIADAIAAILAQDCPEPFEVIVVVSGSPPTADVVRRSFGDRVTLVELAEPALPGRARNAGLARARGEYVSFPGSHVKVLPGSLAARVEAHEQGWAMVTGSIVNGNPTPAGWASYFLDHSSALPGRPSNELSGAPAHCSYVREFLLEVGGFREDLRAGEDTVANQELWRRGYRAYREQRIELIHRSPCSTAVRLFRHHFARGRGFGRILRGDFSRSRRRRRIGPLRFLLGYPRRRLRDTDRRVADWGGELRDEYARARRLVKLGTAAAWLGAVCELLRPFPGRPAGRPSAQLRVFDVEASDG